MARPRKDQEGEDARARIEHAFWELLDEMPYRSISVRLLSQRAGVNRNTFYYHFDSVQDLALRLISSNIPSEWFEAAAALFSGQNLEFERFSASEDLQRRFDRFRLLLRGGDPSLIVAGKQLVLERMLSTLGIDPHALGPHQRAKMTFFIGGLAALLTSDEVDSFQHYVDLLQDGLAEIAADILHQVANGQ